MTVGAYGIAFAHTAKGVYEAARTASTADVSSLAVLWTALTVIGLVGMGAMMHGGMKGVQESGGMMDGMMGGGMMGGMMLYMGLTWIITHPVGIEHTTIQVETRNLAYLCRCRIASTRPA